MRKQKKGTVGSELNVKAKGEGTNKPGFVDTQCELSVPKQFGTTGHNLLAIET